MRNPPICSNVVYHIYNRGVSKRKIFLMDDDYRFFMYKLSFYNKKYLINLISFCLMPNHFHLLLYTEDEKENISKFMKGLQLSYAFYYNKKHDHSGHVFQGKYKNKVVNHPLYMDKITKYISENPVRKKLVKAAKEWPYSG